AATPRTRSRPMSIDLGCCCSMYSSHSARVMRVTEWRAGANDPSLQRAMHGLAEQRRVVAAVVEADQLQPRRVRPLQQVQGGRRLAEAPQPREGDSQHVAQ